MQVFIQFKFLLVGNGRVFYYYGLLFVVVVINVAWSDTFLGLNWPLFVDPKIWYYHFVYTYTYVFILKVYT